SPAIQGRCCAKGYGACGRRGQAIRREMPHIAVNIFVMGGPDHARAQFIAAASNEPAAPPTSQLIDLNGWAKPITALSIDLVGPPLRVTWGAPTAKSYTDYSEMRVHLCDGRLYKTYAQARPGTMNLGGWDWEVLISGFMGFIVIDDGSPQAKSD